MRQGIRGLLIGLVLVLAACQGPPTFWLERDADGDQEFADGDTIPQDGDLDTICTPDTTRCASLSVIELCDEDGRGWRPYRVCPAEKVCLQSDDWASCEACANPPEGTLCCPGAFRCRGSDELQQCDGTGRNWLFSTDCSEQGRVCLEGTCVVPQDGDSAEDEPDAESESEVLCTPGSRVCIDYGRGAGVCSADGQHVEESYRCIDGYLCKEDGQCKKEECVNPFPGTCGLLLIVCCEGSFCVPTPDYPAGTCSPDPLPPFCTPGERVCADERTPAVCEAEGRTLTQLASCEYGESCIQGRCVVPGCPIECPDETACTANDMGQCRCQNPSACGGAILEPCCPGYSCSATDYHDSGYCQKNPEPCTPGVRSCLSKSVPQICEADSVTQTPLAECAGNQTCKEGRCVYEGCPPTCPNGRYCLQGMEGCGIVDCWDQPPQCGLLMPSCCPGSHCNIMIYGVLGYCVEDYDYPACTPGERFCSSGAPAVCESDGRTPALLEPCTDGVSCKDGYCQEPSCAPGALACATPITPTICEADGQTRAKLPKCLPGQNCNEGNCVYPGCPASCPEDQYCLKNSGGCTALDSCENPLLCGPGSQVCCQGFSCQLSRTNEQGDLEGFCIYADPPSDCTPGTRVCGGLGDIQTVDICEMDGHSRRTETLCSENEVCLNGRCQPPPCTPGALSCVTAYSPAICGEDGQTQISLGLCPPMTSCNEGHCVTPGCPPTCPQGQVCIDGVCQSSPTVCRNPTVCGLLLPPCCTGYKCSAIVYGVEGFCISTYPTCTPGERLCLTEDIPGFCEADGQSRVALPRCPEGTSCLNGLCRNIVTAIDCPAPCPENYICDTQYGQCVLDCLPCATGYHCDATTNSECVQDIPAACSPGVLSCLDAATPQICLEDGQTRLALASCANDTSCSEGHCITPGCPPTCDEGLTCNAETQGRCEYLPGPCNPSYCFGFSSDTQRCCQGYFCSSKSLNAPGHCIKDYDDPCLPGTRLCADAKYPAICQSDGHSRGLLPACPFGEICSDGNCTPKDGGYESGGPCYNPAFCDTGKSGECCPNFYCRDPLGLHESIGSCVQ